MVLFIVMSIVVSKQTQRAKISETEYKASLAVQIEQLEHILGQYDRDLSEEWPVRHVRGADWRNRRYLMMSSDQKRLSILLLQWRGELIETWEALIEISSVVSVEIRQDQSTVMKLEATGHTKKIGSLGRAAVGGVLFGGVGAIVGASTAGSKTVTTASSTSETHKGPVYLVLGTTDIQHPMHKVLMNSRQEGEKWLHRIRGALSLAAAR
jgi:hypothetical protein